MIRKVPSKLSHCMVQSLLIDDSCSALLKALLPKTSFRSLNAQMLSLSSKKWFKKAGLCCCSRLTVRQQPSFLKEFKPVRAHAISQTFIKFQYQTDILT